jgi:DNA polymerase III subunit alpha
VNTRRGLDRMTQFYDKCVVYAESIGLTKAEFDDVWRKVLQFSKYGFNKSHAACYALDGYVDKWLKERWPRYMYASMLSVRKGKVPKIVREALNAGVTILPPDINSSGFGFSIDGVGVRFGLDAIHDVGTVAVREIERLQPFSGIDDFRARTTKRICNKKVVEGLIEAGAMDRWGMRDHLSMAEMHAFEKHRLKFALTSMAAASSDAQLVEERVNTGVEIDGMSEGAECTVGGEVTMVKQIVTKKGADMAFVEVEHGAESFRITFFPRQFAGANGSLEVGKMILVKGTLDADGTTVLAGDYCTVDALKAALS